MPNLLRTFEQQLRLVPESSEQLKRALLLPIRTWRKYRESLANCQVRIGDEFDERYGTDTTTRVHMTDLRVESANWIHASPYFPTPTGLLYDAIHESKMRVTQLTFVDLGSGKGRVLLQASQLPFRKIIGVEFSPELNAIAERNFARYIWHNGLQRCSDISVVCADFTRYEFPQEPLFVFLYNPADLALSRIVAERLLDSLRAAPRECWVLYVTPYPVFEGEP